MVPNEVIEYIATNCENDVRHLEGAITRLYAYAAMMGPKEINLEFAVDALKDYIGKSIYITNDIQKIQKAQIHHILYTFSNSPLLFPRTGLLSLLLSDNVIFYISAVPSLH